MAAASVPDEPASTGDSRQTIAIAVVERDACLLVGQRPAGVPLAGMWEFPGGKVLTGETPAEAAVRECLEETGLTVTAGRRLAVVEHRYEHGRLVLHFFTCQLADPDPLPQPPFRWVTHHELRQLQFPPANHEVLRRLLAG